MAYERFVECRVEDPVPLCPYCDNSLDGPTVNGMHKRCHRLYNEELDLISSIPMGNTLEDLAEMARQWRTNNG